MCWTVNPVLLVSSVHLVPTGCAAALLACRKLLMLRRRRLRFWKHTRFV